MARLSKSERTWSDSQLKEAIAASANWRTVTRSLGLNANSAGAIRIVRRHAVNLGLDTSHFRGKRTWSDAQLRRAVMDAQSWDELLMTLSLAPRSGNGKVRVKAHAMRLGLDLAHLENPAGDHPGPDQMRPDLRYLRDAATSMAASWFSLCGLSVALPVEPALYDLLVTTPGGIKRVQIKTTTRYGKDGWTVTVGRGPLFGRQPGTPDSLRSGIDRLVFHHGRQSRHLRDTEPRYRGTSRHSAADLQPVHVGNAAGFMTPKAA